MVGADDCAAVAGPADREKLVASVPAGVREGAQCGVLAADQEHACEADLFGTLVTWLGHLLAVAYTHPAAREEVTLFPTEHGWVDVGGAGEHATVAEASEGLLDLHRIQRRRCLGARSCRGLTDHTVRLGRAAPGVQPSPVSSRPRCLAVPERIGWVAALGASEATRSRMRHLT